MHTEILFMKNIRYHIINTALRQLEISLKKSKPSYPAHGISGVNGKSSAA